MINNEWYDVFLEMLYKKYPKKNQLTEALTDLLCLEREAVYRRLRQDVLFPVNEVVKIASAWNISLDETIGLTSQKVSFQMHPVNYIAPSEEDVDFLQKKVQVLTQITDYQGTGYVVVCNHLSRSLIAGFANLYKFHVFKWAYEYYNNGNANEKSSTTLSDIVIPENVLSQINLYKDHIKYVKTTTYILDNMIFDSYVRDIKFFHSIFLLNDEEKKILKNELYALLDYLLEVANNGCFPETKNEVNMYISMLHINTNYSYLYTKNSEACRIHTFNMYDVTSYNQEMIVNFKAWLQKKKGTSVKISEADEKSRVEFFMKQRLLVDSL